VDDGFDHEAWSENDGFVGILSKPFPHRGPWNDLSGEPVYDGFTPADRSAPPRPPERPSSSSA
jgi:hypothetical protein